MDGHASVGLWASVQHVRAMGATQPQDTATPTHYPPTVLNARGIRVASTHATQGSHIPATGVGLENANSSWSPTTSIGIGSTSKKVWHIMISSTSVNPILLDPAMKPPFKPFRQRPRLGISAVWLCMPFCQGQVKTMAHAGLLRSSCSSSAVVMNLGNPSCKMCYSSSTKRQIAL